jgi:hypothetical protein
MLDHSVGLKEAVESYSQYVKPKVIARFGDNRYLQNLKVKSSNQNYDDAILSYNPSVYWKFFEKNYSPPALQAGIVDYSGNNNSGVYTPLSGSPSVIADPAYVNQPERFCPIIADNFVREYPSVIYQDNLFVKNTDIPFLFNLGRNRWFIQNNQMKMSTIISKKLDYALIETGGADGYVQARIETDAKNVGVIFRYVNDENYIFAYVDITTSKFYLEETINNVKNITEVTNSSNLWLGSKVLKLEIIGTYAKLYFSDTLILSKSLVNKNISPKATRHGLGARDAVTYTLSSPAIIIDPITGIAVPPEAPPYEGFIPSWTNLEINAYKSNNYCLKLNDASIRLNNKTISNVNDITFGFAFKPSVINQEQKLFKLFNPNLNDYSIKGSLNNSNQLSISLKKSTNSGTTTGDTVLTTPLSLSTNQWVNVVVVVESNIAKLFVNGSLVAQSSHQDTFFTRNINSIFLAEDGTGRFNGSVDDLFFIQRPLSSDEIGSLYGLSLEANFFRDGKDLFNGEQAFNTIEEETFPYITLDSKDELGKKLILNGEYYLIGDRFKPKDSYFFLSNQKSKTELSLQNDYEFLNNPYISATFSPARVSRFTLSTGEMLEQIKRFELKYHINGTPSGEFVTAEITEFPSENSVVEILLDETIEVDEILLIIKSTKLPACKAVVHQINLYYEEDISEDVISFNFSKVRENYEATLPIGSTAANNGSLSLNNTHQKYNVFNASSPYFGYINPEIKIDLSLVYRLEDDTFEEVVVGKELFVESWQTSSDSMSVDLSFVDWSVVLQELTADNGFVFEDVVAGRAVRDVVRSAGFPSRKISYYDSFHRTILKDRPVGYWRMNNSMTVITGVFGPQTLLRIEDEGGRYHGYAAPETHVVDTYSVGITPIVKQEQRSDIDNDSRSLASLYQITAASVGDIPFKVQKKNYAIQVNGKTENPSLYPAIEIDSTNAVGGHAATSSPEFTVEAVIEPQYIADGEERAIVSKANPDGHSYYIYLKRTGNVYSIVGSVGTSSGTYLCQHDFDSSLIGKSFHIMFVRQGSKITLYVNGEAEQANAPGATFLAPNHPMVILRRYYSNTAKSFDGKISHVAFYDRALSNDIILKHYQIFTFDKLYLFPYLYFFDATYWDGLLEFATADVGMFYFDEYSNFIYDYKNVFHEEALKQHSEVQYHFDVDTNIISSNYVLDVHTNKIQVKVNPKTRLKSEVTSLWRADSGESLAITKLTSGITASSSFIEVANTENPIWPRSGYLKIDDEIIKYNNREINRFLELERGSFDTIPSLHSANALCREARVYDIEFSEKPATSVRYPFIIAQIFEGRVDIDKFESTPFGGNVLVSASDNSSLNNPNNNETNLVFLEGANPLTGKEYFFSIAGVPVVEKTSEEKVSDEVRDFSARKFRKKELIIDNKFIQTAPYARSVIDFLLTFFGSPVPIIDIDCIGVPFLQLGDLVQIDNMPDLNVYNKKYWIIETSLEYDGGLKQTFVLRLNTDVV